MKPCKDCPFSRLVTPGALGGSKPEVYVGQIVGPFWLPCHCSANYEGRASDVNQVKQCAGAAIMRSNLGIIPPAPLLRLPPSITDTFTTLAEFYAHHAGTSVEAAEQYLTMTKVRELFFKEMNDPRVRLQAKRREDK